MFTTLISIEVLHSDKLTRRQIEKYLEESILGWMGGYPIDDYRRSIKAIRMRPPEKQENTTYTVVDSEGKQVGEIKWTSKDGDWDE